MCRYVYPPTRIPEDLGHVHNDTKQSSAHGDFVAELSVLILELIRPEKIFQICQLDIGHAAEPPSKLMSPWTHWVHWPSLLYFPNALPISCGSVYRSLARVCWLCFFCTGNSTILAYKCYNLPVIFGVLRVLRVKTISPFLPMPHPDVFPSPLDFTSTQSSTFSYLKALHCCIFSEWFYTLFPQLPPCNQFKTYF